MKHALLPIFAMLLSACGGHGVGPTTPVDVQVRIGAGQSLEVEGAVVTLRFDAVTEDSRCPADAFCISAGVAVARLTMVAAGRETALELRSDPAERRVAQVEGLRLEWVQLEPYPVSSGPIQPSDYRITLRVSR